MIHTLITSIKNTINYLIDEYKTTKIDNMIVGGGIIGTSLAYNLSLSNSSVVLIDKETIGSGATCLSAGTIYSPFEKLPPFEILKENLISDNFINSYLSIGTIEILKEINNKIDCNFTQPGSITIGSSRTKNYLLDIIKNGTKMGQKLELLTSENTKDMSLNAKIALYTPNSAQINPCKVVHAFAKLAEENGTIILDNTFIKDIKYESSFYNITLNNLERYRCKNLILTNGIDVNKVSNICDIYVPIIPVKGLMWNIELSNDDLDLYHIIYSSNSSYSWSNNSTLDIQNSIPNYCTHDINGNIINNNKLIKSLYYNKELNIEHYYGKPYTDDNGVKNIMFGCNRQIAIDNNDYNIDEKKIKECFNKIKKLLPNIKNTETDGYWCGLMPFSLYGKPIIGNFKCFDHPNLWIANGFGAYGITIGPMSTKLLSNIILNKDDNAQIILQRYNVFDNGCTINKKHK